MTRWGTFAQSGRTFTREENGERELRRIVERFHKDPRRRTNDEGKPSRTATLYASAVSMGAYVREGWLTAERAERELTAAGVKEGLTERDARRSASRGLGAGIDDPSKVVHEGYTVSDDAPRGRAHGARPKPSTPRSVAYRFRGAPLELAGPKSWPLAERQIAALPSGAIPPVPATDPGGAPVGFTRWSSHREEGEAERHGDVRTWGSLLDALPLEAPPASWPRDANENRLPLDEDRKKLLPLVSFAAWPTPSRAMNAPKPETTCALVLDYDDDPAWSLNWTRETFKGLRWAGWTTANHGRDKGGRTGPRGRVVVHLSRAVNADELRTLTAWSMSAAAWGRPSKDGASLARPWIPPVQIPTVDGGPPSMLANGGRDAAPLDVDATLTAIRAALADVDSEPDEPDDDELDDDEPDDDTEDAPASDPWGPPWRPVGDWWGKVERPPVREWLLVDRRKTDAAGRPCGVFPLGRVGMLAAAGGAGKSWVAFDLAVSVAVGRPALRPQGGDEPALCPPVAQPGSAAPYVGGAVLALFGEEEQDEAARRLHGVVYGPDPMSDYQRQLLQDRLTIVPLAGHMCGVLDERGDPTGAGRALLDRVRPMAPLRLIIVDPLSRFAGPGAELDNRLATGFIAYLESLAQAAGGASVLVVHHSSQGARLGGQTDSTAARGVTGLVDACRWVAVLGKVKDSGALTLNIDKNSYGPSPDPIYLERTEGGALRQIAPPPAEEGADSGQAPAGKRGGGTGRARRPVGPT